MTTSGREVGITWDWAEAGRDLLCALPGAVICSLSTSAWDRLRYRHASGGAVGVPPQPRQRARLGLVGAGFAVSYGLGSVLGRWPVAAVAALTVLAAAAVLFSVRRPGARLLPALLLPGSPSG